MLPPGFSFKSYNISSYEIHNSISKVKDLLTFPAIWKLYNAGHGVTKLSNGCQLHLEEAVKQFGKEIWPIQMADAWGKFPEGLLSGHIGMMGDFEECMLMRGSVQDQHNASVPFGGRYCPMHLVMSQELLENINTNFSSKTDKPLYSIGEELNFLMTQPTLAACLPTACTRNDFNILFSSLTSVTQGLMTPITSYCQTDDKPPLDGAVIAMMVLVALILCVTLVASGLDLLLDQRSRSSSKLWKALMSFSVPKNVQRLTSINASEDLGCLHGLRFGSMCWVVLIHTWSIISYSAIWNSFRISTYYESWSILTVINGSFCVDTFFTLAGFLISYQLLRGLDKHADEKFNPLKLYLHRFLRITPTYAFLLGLIATFQPYLSNGPMWSIIDMNSKYCRRNWWENLLYINNLVAHDITEDPTNVPCFAEAWYLGCDMQFFIVSIWLVFLIWKHRRTGFVLLLATTIVSVVTPGWIIGAKNLMPTSIPFRPPSGEETGNYDIDVYVKPWTRYGPYVAGIWTGYVYYLFKSTQFRFSRPATWVGWASATATALAVVYGPVRFFDHDIPLGKIESVLYGGLARFAWGAVVGWIIFACLIDNGGPINWFLSAKPFVPLGRITFCMYLVSYELQQMFHARYPHPLSYDVYFLVNLFLAHLALSILIGFWITILIESSFTSLTKTILGN